jgi:hypothetical protein
LTENDETQTLLLAHNQGHYLIQAENISTVLKSGFRNLSVRKIDSKYSIYGKLREKMTSTGDKNILRNIRQYL